MLRSPSSICRVTAILAALSAGSLSLAQVPANAEIIEKGVTVPSERQELAFRNQGIIDKVNVKEGDVIKANQPLMLQDDRIEKKRLEALTLEADRSLMIRAQLAKLENKKVELKRTQEMFDREAKSESELLQAKLEVTLAEAEWQVEQHNQRTKEAERDLQALRVEDAKLLAPADGIVEKIVQRKGEVADIDKPSIIVVKNDPLYIEVKTLSRDVVGTLKYGQELDVRYAGGEWQKAKINFIAPQANAAAQSHPIRLEMPNPEGRTTGQTIEVKIPAPPMAAAR